MENNKPGYDSLDSKIDHTRIYSRGSKYCMKCHKRFEYNNTMVHIYRDIKTGPYFVVKCTLCAEPNIIHAICDE